MEKETAKKVKDLAYVLATLVDSITSVGNSQIKTLLIDSAKQTTKEILELLGE